MDEDGVNPAQVQKFLEGVEYPASKQELVEYARAQGADNDVIETLEDLPEREYSSPNDVSDAMGDLE